MKKVILLLFILSSFNILALSSNNLSNSTKSSEQKEKNLELEEIEKLKQQIKEMNIKLSIMEKESNKIGLTYNIDQIYSTADSFYSKTVDESKVYYKTAFDFLEKTLFWFIGTIITVLLGNVGLSFWNKYKIDSSTDEKIADLKKEFLPFFKENIECTSNQNFGWIRTTRPKIYQYIILEKSDFNGINNVRKTFPISFSSDIINHSFIGKHNLKVLELNSTSIVLNGSIEETCKVILSGY